MKQTKKQWKLISGLLGCLCFGAGEWLMMYADPTFEGNIKWLTLGTAAIVGRL